jgi:hypothetical protein
MSLETLRALFAEATYRVSPDPKRPLLPPTVLVLLMEVLKCGVALVQVLGFSSEPYGRRRKRRSLSAEGSFHGRKSLGYFVPSALLYFVNNGLYYWILGESSAGVLSLFLHLKIPTTLVVHHFLVKRQDRARAWWAVFVVFVGIGLTQVHSESLFAGGFPSASALTPSASTTAEGGGGGEEDGRTSSLLRVMGVALLICVNSALASVMNEWVLKNVDMPFWDQQLRMYGLGVLVSLSTVLFPFSSVSSSSSSSSSFDSSMSSWLEVQALTRDTVLVSAGCILCGALSGLSTGFLVYKMDNVVKVLANTGNTVLISVLGFVLFGEFKLSWTFFWLGTGLICYGSYLYAVTVARVARGETERGDKSPLRGGVWTKTVPWVLGGLLTLCGVALIGIPFEFFILHGG